MRVTCLIDSLGSGGAQRQLCTLAVLLKRRGWDVSMMTYHPFDFFLPLIREAGIEYTCIRSRSLLHRIWSIRRILRRGDQDVVLASLDGPVLYAELAAIPRRRWGLVVSEQNAVPTGSRPYLAWLRRFHRMADYVTPNSHTNRLMIERDVPSLKKRIVTIYNTVDFDAFPPTPLPRNDDPRQGRIVVAARYEPQKNPLGFIEAVAIARAKAPSFSIQLDWHGHLGTAADRDLYFQARQLVERRGLQECVRLHEESRTIAAEYGGADAVALPSFYEGLPNTICEAMSMGRPILMSDVCDAGNLVKPGENGFLFDPASPEDMARALVEFAATSATHRESMGHKSRQMAEQMFDPNRVVAAYDAVLRAAALRQRVPLEHWIPETPDSAERFTNAH